MLIPDPENEVRLWKFPAATVGLWDIQSYLEVPAESCLPLVPASSRPRVLRYRQNTDRQRTLLAEVLLRHLLSKTFGSPPQAFVILREKNGKPYLDGESAQISLSHAANWCAAALSPHPVGIDVEANAVSEEIAARFFAPGEANASASGRLHLWTLKEAFCKCSSLPLEEALRFPASEFTSAGLSSYSLELPYGWLSVIVKTR